MTENSVNFTKVAHWCIDMLYSYSKWQPSMTSPIYLRFAIFEANYVIMAIFPGGPPDHILWHCDGLWEKVFYDCKLMGVDWSKSFLEPAAADLAILQGTSALPLHFRQGVHVHLLYKASDVHDLATVYVLVMLSSTLWNGRIPKYSVFSVNIFIT